MNDKASWQHFQHVADIGVRGCGHTIEEAFTQAALATTAVITDLPLVESEECIEVECHSTSLEYLFVDWLNVLIYEMATRHMLFNTFDIHINEGQLKAKICGEKVNQEKHQPAVEIKGATLTELEVKQDNEGIWCAQCIVDV